MTFWIDMHEQEILLHWRNQLRTCSLMFSWTQSAGMLCKRNQLLICCLCLTNSMIHTNWKGVNKVCKKEIFTILSPPFFIQLPFQSDSAHHLKYQLILTCYCTNRFGRATYTLTQLIWSKEHHFQVPWHDLRYLETLSLSLLKTSFFKS